MRFAYVVPAVVFASQASAFLQSRQLEGLLGAIPEQCQSTCAPILALTECPQDTSAAAQECVCKDSTFTSIDTCFDCLFELLEEMSPGSSDPVRAQVEPFRSQLEEACNTGATPSDDSEPSSSSSQVVVRPSSSADDDSSSSSRASTRSSPTNTGTSRSSTPTSGSSDSDSTPAGDDLLGGASTASLAFSGIAAAAAGVVFLL